MTIHEQKQIPVDGGTLVCRILPDPRHPRWAGGQRNDDLLRKTLKKLLTEMKEEQVLKAAKLLRITFDVKRAFGAGTLKSVFEKVNKSREISLEAKNQLYEAIRRKRVDIPPPAMGKRSCSQV